MPIKRTEPTAGLYSRSFRYQPAAKTDLRETFERVRRELRKAERVDANGQRLLNFEPVPVNVVALRARNGTA